MRSGGPGSTNSSTTTSSSGSSSKHTGSPTSSTASTAAAHAGTTKPNKTSAKPTAAAGGIAGWHLHVFKMTGWHVLLGCVCLAVASYFGYRGYLETRVNTPYDERRVVQPRAFGTSNAESDADAAGDRFWGSYRPGTYFGLKTRDPQSLVVGLMWFAPARLQPGGTNMRHWCDSGDNLQRYGWNQHDGRTFGVQGIEDGSVRLETSFVKFAGDNGGASGGGDWTARIAVEPVRRADRPAPDDSDIISLIWYTALDEKTGGHITTDSQTAHTGVRGHTPGLGDFHMHIHPTANTTVLHESYLSTVAGGLQHLHQLTMAHFRLVDDERSPFGNWIALPGDVLTDRTGAQLPANYIATMITGRPPFAIDVAFKSTAGMSAEAATRAVPPPIGDAYTAALQQHRDAFDVRFEQLFQLSAKGYTAAEQRFAQSAMSNMLGGIGYFYGASRVQSEFTPDAVPYWRAPLYTAVPSRSFFPRGFLWDEGFHGLLIGAWDADIGLDIMAHWMDLMNSEGWIPREQILGVEALAKVPEQFVTQRNTAANPPTFFLTLKALLARTVGAADGRPKLRARHVATLQRMYPRLQAWFAWFNGTQRGQVAGSYRWRGRDEHTIVELNPKTLTSGLDDYPRASHPTPEERHVDLRCWVALAAGVMADLSRLLELDDFRYLETFYYLSDQQLLDEQHLSPFTGTYADWGLHTDAVALKRAPPIVQTMPLKHHQQTQAQHVIANPRKIRVVAKQPEPRFVDTTFGYVSLFPMLLELLPADAPSLGKCLEMLRDPAVLWTPFGLRSLSRASPLYMQRNTEDDPPYWRGQIWLNINYLAVKALHHYGRVEGPFAARAREIYGELRANVVRNVVAQYERTGFVWEQYNDATGAGSGCKPFTGWSALTVLMMAEQY